MFEPTIYLTLSDLAMFSIRKQNMSAKNTILLLCEDCEQLAVSKEKRELHIRTNCLVQCLRYSCLLLLLLLYLCYPNVALIIDLIGTKENTLMHTMPDMP